MLTRHLFPLGGASRRSAADLEGVAGLFSLGNSNGAAAATGVEADVVRL